MQQILQAINGLNLALIEQRELSVIARSSQQLWARNPSDFALCVGADSVVDLVLLHDDTSKSSISISLDAGATLRLVQLFMGEGLSNMTVTHAQGATSNIIAVSGKSNKSTFNLDLLAQDASSSVDTVQLGSYGDASSLKINMRHTSEGCTSRSLSKCVASGDASLVFDGLVYVAQDAQRTLAEQNCRSLALSDTAHITAHPQLEIYADDVKCSHGATVGQMDSDAILYMRQRGLSEALARRVQIEGFVTDVVDKCEIEELREALKEIITHKLEEM